MTSLDKFYLRHERAVLGGCAIILFLLFWEGLERGWWSDLLQPLIGGAAERWRIKPIFISSPTRVVQAAYRMFFVTGEIWRDLGWSGLEFAIWILIAIAIGMPLGLAAGWYRLLSYAVAPFLSALNATPQVAFTFERYWIPLSDWVLADPAVSKPRLRLVFLLLAGLLLAPLPAFAAYISLGGPS